MEELGFEVNLYVRTKQNNTTGSETVLNFALKKW